jgi:UDP-glucose 4-epimerase
MTYVSNVVEATAAALEAQPDGSPRAYNVGGGARTTVRKLVSLVREIMGEHLEVSHGPPVPGDVRSTWADLHRATRELGYEPRVSLVQGMEAQVRWALAGHRAPSMAL